MKIRIKFEKDGMMRFIGHLDIMRYFQKAMRRSQIDIAYSGGYNPHQIMSFALPLGLGLTSSGEYLDIEVYSSTSTEEALAALNQVMVEGIRVTEYKLLPEDAPNAMSSVAAAGYRLTPKDGSGFPTERETLLSLEEKWKDFFAQESILVTKQTKKSQREVDLRPLIYQESFVVTEQGPEITLLLSAGSVDNIKPELVLDAFFQSLPDTTYFANQFAIQRLELYAESEGHTFKPLGEFGTNL